MLALFKLIRAYIIDSIFFCQEIAAIFELFEYRHILAIAFYVAVLIAMYSFGTAKIVTFLRPYTFRAMRNALAQMPIAHHGPY